LPDASPLNLGVPRVLVVIGTRPEAIKMAPVVSALRQSGEIETRVVLTGQHTTLVDQALDIFGLTADRALGIMKEGQSLYDVARGCLDGLRSVVEELRPWALLVQGDTATVCFGAMVGFFENVRVGHVEAGLRTGRRRFPFPEEMFRRVADTLADWHFAPTPRARDHLLAEQSTWHPEERGAVHVTGNTIVDALLSVAQRLPPPKDPALVAALSSGQRLVLLTAHRRESFGSPLNSVFNAVRKLADARDDVTVICPVHLNPKVRGPAHHFLGSHPRIVLTEPLDYFDLVRTLRDAALVLTDSGGIQEEAPTFGTPVLVLREVTERPEVVETGLAELVGTDPALLLERANDRLNEASSPRGTKPSPFGDGRAGERIADIVISELTGRPRRTTDWEGP
jgi:UDP-N-acetylglucosamine 2-epimerase (non-hydrolysing)